jgi:hypothetical protein
MNSSIIQEVRGKGLLNAVVIDGKAGNSAEDVAWEICLKMADLGMVGW